MLHDKQGPDRSGSVWINPLFADEAFSEVPKHALAAEPMSAAAAARIVADELMVDGNARLNLATFVTTWMEPEAQQLMSATFEKNAIDKDEYPQTAAIEARCVSILAHLWESPDSEQAVGTSTIGSSEAAMLAGLALKWRWRSRRRAAGAGIGAPNLVMGANVQVCWEKFCRYFDVEPRLVPVDVSRRHLTPEAATAHCDENTIGVVAILGSTYDGSYEPVAAIAAALDDLAASSSRRVDIPMHVDAASGGFVAPFLQPDLRWDFRVPRVCSINASGHKYGLVYPGVGWVVWRDRDALPDDLVFNVDYLGGQMPTFTLNFSRPGNQILGQYYTFLRLGRRGYTQVHQASQNVARHLSSAIADRAPFTLLTDGSDIPVFSWRIRDGYDAFDAFELSEHLRERGWQVPAYRLPPDAQDTVVLRVVVRNGFSHDLADLFLADIDDAIAHLERAPGERRPQRPSAFSHT
jgi:glutamate decarboxylase